MMEESRKGEWWGGMFVFSNQFYLHLLSVIAFPCVSHVLWSGPKLFFFICVCVFFFFGFIFFSETLCACGIYGCISSLRS